MKTKIILTSMVAMMVGCPAFAEVSNGVMNGESPYSEDCQGAPIGGVTANNSTVTYTARWDACSATVVYDCGNQTGCSSTGDTTITTGVSFNLGVATVNGYNFNGWSCNHNLANGGNTTTPYTTNQSVSEPVVPCQDNLTYTCTAQWGTGATVTYTGDAHCGNVSVTTSGMSSGTQYQIEGAGTNNVSSGGLDLSGITADTGYHYKEFSAMSWDCVDSNNNTVSPVSGVITIGTDNITCTMTCVGNNINLQWFDEDGTTNLNTGENSLGNTGSCVFGTTDGISSINNPEKTGYRFTGWTIPTNTNQ